MSEIIKYIKADEFEQEILNSDIPVAVDFYSEECPPCAALAPIYERMATKYGQHMKFVKIFRQQNRELADKLEVKSSPTVLFFQKGQEVGKRLTGYIKKPEMRIIIESIIGDVVGAVAQEKTNCDVLILGGGPAGLAAAIYAGRAKMNTIVLEEGLTGGQAATTFHIANYPGTDGVIGGSVLMTNMKNQALSFGVKIDDFKEIFEVNLLGDTKFVQTEDKQYFAKVVIVATGAEPRKLPAEGEDSFRGRGVHYCATCDGAMYQDSKVIVVGGGNSAVEEAVFLTKFASNVTIIHQFDYFQASQIAQEEAFKNDKIDVIWDSEPRKVNGESHLTSLTIENVKTGQQSDVETDGVFVYIGTQPRTDIFKGQLDMNEWGYITANEEMNTNVSGVFAAGDVRVKSIRQVVTAAADGAIAGINAERYIVANQKEKQVVLQK